MRIKPPWGTKAGPGSFTERDDFILVFRVPLVFFAGSNIYTRMTRPRKVHATLLPAILLIVAWALPFSAFAGDTTTNVPSDVRSITANQDSTQPKTLDQLLALPPDRLEDVDIARLDLLCAKGLPGSEHLDVEKDVQTLDGWARYVKSETERNFHRFEEHPEQFKNSLGRYRMAVMAAVLSQDLRVQYDPAREKELFEHHFFADGEPYGEAERSFFSDSSDIFLNGLVSDKRYGTCASLPLLYVALGRRLGYPVSLARTRMHGYVYYDEGGGNHFNFEATENRGFLTPSDEEYKHPAWGAPSSPEYFQSQGMLRPLSNKEAFGHILAERAAVFRSEGRHEEEAKTWEIASRYFPDTPTWKEIEVNMEQCARLDDYQKWRDGIWKELAAYYIPHGPGFAYFQQKKIELRMFMDESADRPAIEQAANEYKKELADYSATVSPRPESGAVSLNITNQSVPEMPRLFFYYRPPDGNEVKVPADFMPPFPRGQLPAALQNQIVNTKPQDPDALLEMVWQYFGQMQEAALAKQKAEADRIASGNPILISEESIPPEFRQAVPTDLAIRLSGLHDAQDIVMTMWQYKQQHEMPIETLANPMAQVGSILRQAGVPDFVARASGLPVAGAQMPNDPVAAALQQAGIPMAVAQRAGLPTTGLPAGTSSGIGLNASGGGLLTAQGQGTALANNFGSTTTPGERTKQGNKQAMEMAAQLMGQQDVTKPGFALPYQVVPASVAAGNPAVQNPMPLGGMPSSQLPLTTAPAAPITQSTNKSNAP
jgi:hypothetical protein